MDSAAWGYRTEDQNTITVTDPPAPFGNSTKVIKSVSWQFYEGSMKKN